MVTAATNANATQHSHRTRTRWRKPRAFSSGVSALPPHLARGGREVSLPGGLKPGQEDSRFAVPCVSPAPLHEPMIAGRGGSADSGWRLAGKQRATQRLVAELCGSFGPSFLCQLRFSPFSSDHFLQLERAFRMALSPGRCSVCHWSPSRRVGSAKVLTLGRGGESPSGPALPPSTPPGRCAPYPRLHLGKGGPKGSVQ